MRRLLLATASLGLLGACDRAIPEEEQPDLARGTFEATIRQVGGAGFEDLSGTAVFSASGAGTVVVRLASPIAPRPDTTRLDLIVDPMTTALGEGRAALCYRSPLFADGAYRDEAGTLTVTRADGATVEGTLDGTAFLDLQTGPTTSIRQRVRVAGTFRAVPATAAAPVPDAATVRRCLPE